MVSRRLITRLSMFSSMPAALLGCILLSLVVYRPVGGQEGSAENRNKATFQPTPPSLATRNRGTDWASFLGPTSDGKSTEKGILSDWSGGRLKTRWHSPLGTSYGIGSVAGGRYFQFDRMADKQRLRCFHAETGQPLWSDSQPVDYQDMYGYNNGPRSSPAISGPHVYTFGVDGQLTCRRVTDGQLVWTVNANEKYGVIQ